MFLFSTSRFVILFLPLPAQIPSPSRSLPRSPRNPSWDLCVTFLAVTFLPLSTASDVRRTLVSGGRRCVLQDQAGPSPGRHRVWGRQGNRRLPLLAAGSPTAPGHRACLLRGHVHCTQEPLKCPLGNPRRAHRAHSRHRGAPPSLSPFCLIKYENRLLHIYINSFCQHSWISFKGTSGETGSLAL